MEAVVLSVFGAPCLVQGQKVLLSAPLPLLLAAYVVIEHQGEAAERDEIRRVFFPQAAEPPEEFSALARTVYAHLWAHLAQAPNMPTLWLADASLRRVAGANFSDAFIQDAHAQLQEYAIIERAVQEAQGFRYWPDSRFQRYLTGEKKDGADRVSLVGKTFSAHISTLRRCIKQSAPEQAQHSVPVGKTGQSRQALVIRLPCTAELLAQALAARDGEMIRALYCAPFLANIEQDLRADLWLPPGLRAWIARQRAGFARQVEDGLRALAVTARAPEPDDSDKISLAALNGMVTPGQATSACGEKSGVSIPPISIYPFVFQNVIEGALPLHLRKHLLNKTSEECEIALQAARTRWISAYVSVQRAGRWTNTRFDVRDPALLPLFLEKSYGFAVLLGDAGMGKSLVLCYLAQALAQAARKRSDTPVPLLLHLADWARRAWSFEDWLKYRLVRLGLGEKLVDTYLERLLGAQQCLLLLDGFDNLPPLQRPLYLQRIHRFVREHGEAHLGGVILASRTEEYQVAHQQLLQLTPDADFYFHTEAMLLPLAQTDVQAYLAAHTSILTHDTEHWLQTEGLREFLHIPLGLTLFAHNTQQLAAKTVSRHSSEEIKRALVEGYVQEQLIATQDSHAPLYTPPQVKTWLSHIARYLDMGETFHLENLSPRILNPAQQKRYQRDFAIAFGVLFGLMMGGCAGLIFGKRIAQQVMEINQPPMPSGFFFTAYQTLHHWSDSGNWGDTFRLVLVYAGIGVTVAVTLSLVLLWLRGRIDLSLFLGGYLAIFMGFTGWLMVGAQWSFFSTTFYGFLGIVVGLMTDPVHTNLQVIALGKEMRFTFKQLWQNQRGLLLSLLFIPLGMALMLAFRVMLPHLSLSLALVNGFTIGLSFTLAYLAYQSQSRQDWKSQVYFSTQKLQAALKRSLSMTLAIGGLLTLFVTLMGLAYLGWPGSLSFGLRLGIPLGIVFGFMFYGGIEVLKHTVLRWVMYRENLAPANYTAFLEYAKGQGLLNARGSGYAFRHDWFQEYFCN